MNYSNYIHKFEIPSNPLTYYFPIEHARAQEAKLKRMTVELLLELERKNQQSPGVVIEDKRDAYQNMRASVKNNLREAQRQKEGEDKAKENAAKAFNGVLAMGMPSTYYNLLQLNNLLSDRQALALDLGSGLFLGGMGVVTGRQALQKGILQSAKRNYVDLFTNGPVRTYGKVKYYGPTMGKTTASNSTLIDFDDVVRSKIEQLAKSKGVSPKDLKIVSDPDYVLLINDEVVNWKLNPASEGKTLMISNKALSNPSKILFVYDNTPSIPSRDVFIRRLTGRGAGTEAEAADYYNALLKENPNLQLDNRFVSQIENGAVLPSVSNLTEAEKLGIPRGERIPARHSESSSPIYSEDISLYNRGNGIIPIEDGKFVFETPRTAKKLSTIHFTMNEPVTTNSGGNWNGMSTTYIFPYRNIRSLQAPAGIEISDTFFPNYNGLKVSPKKVLILTGDKSIYDYYVSKGLNPEYSEESANIIKKIQEANQKLESFPPEIRYASYRPKEVMDLEKLIDDLGKQNDLIHRNWSRNNGKYFKTLDAIENFRITEQNPWPIAERASSNVIPYRGSTDYLYHSASPYHSNMIYDPEGSLKYKLMPETKKWLLWLVNGNKSDFRKSGGKLNYLNYFK